MNITISWIRWSPLADLAATQGFVFSQKCFNRLLRGWTLKFVKEALAVLDALDHVVQERVRRIGVDPDAGVGADDLQAAHGFEDQIGQVVRSVQAADYATDNSELLPLTTRLSGKIGGMHIGMLLFPRLTQLDLTGPYEVFSRLSDTEVLLLWKTLDAVVSDSGMSILPTTTFGQCPQLDIVFVPGGPGQVAMMEDNDVLRFLQEQARKAKFVTSVCTGSLILAAAGLLKGYRATCHWMSRDLLTELGVEVSPDRYVIDRDRATGGGVTAGIDFALKLALLLRGEQEAKRIQLQLEYSPDPPFDAGSPAGAGSEIEGIVRQRAAKLQEERRVVVQRVKNRLQ